jgi:hypothetical protein
MPGEFIMDIDATGRGTVVVNGQDVSNEIAGVHTYAVPGEPTTVVLQLKPGSDLRLSGEGVVEVEQPMDVRDAMCELLAAINPNMLEAAALERIEYLDEDTSFTTVMLEQLVEVIRNAAVD